MGMSQIIDENAVDWLQAATGNNVHREKERRAKKRERIVLVQCSFLGEFNHVPR